MVELAEHCPPRPFAYQLVVYRRRLF